MQAQPVAPEAADFKEYSADPLGFSTIAGLLPLMAARGQGWVDVGAEPRALLEALRSAPLPPASPDWVGHFTAIADQQPSDAHTVTALSHSAFYNFVARWPTVATPQAQAAYERHLADHVNLCKARGRTVEVLTLSTSAGELVAHLYPSPSSPAPAPVVIVCGGIDAWKSDPEVMAIIEALLTNGMTVVAMDSPGTGQNPVPASPDGELTFRAVVDHLQARSDLGSDRLGILGLSFGGHWAVKLGLCDQRVSAVVNISGPLHHAFDTSWMSGAAAPTLIALATSMGQNFAETGVDALAPALAEMSLVEQGCFEAPHRPAILSIQGAQDNTVPLSDLHEISVQGVEQDTLVFARDRHCASFHFDIHLPFAAAWLARELKRA